MTDNEFKVIFDDDLPRGTAYLLSEPFGFDSDPAGKAPAPVSQPLPQEDDVEAQVKKEILETIGKNSDILPIPEINFDGRQKLNIQLLARGLFLANEPITGEAIWKLWPEGMNKNGRIRASVTDPDERGRVFRAGIRPTINDIQVFLRSEEYAEGMRLLGIEVDPHDTGLTAEQLGLLTILSNLADGRDLKRKLSHAGISWAKYQVWQEQPVFKSYYDKIIGKSLKAAIPMAEQQLAAKMVAGDLTAIKYGFEVSGRHDPNGKKQVDAQAFLAIVLEVIEEKVKDPNVLREIATAVQLRGLKTIEG